MNARTCSVLKYYNRTFHIIAFDPKYAFHASDLRYSKLLTVISTAGEKLYSINYTFLLKEKRDDRLRVGTK